VKQIKVVRIEHFGVPSNLYAEERHLSGKIWTASHLDKPESPDNWIFLE
jgi:hypothetical protein